MERSETLRTTSNYRRCYAQGRRKGGSLLLLYSISNEQAAPRLGMTASGKVGNSVVRHRLKRWAREIYRRWEARRDLPALDFVVHFKREAAAASFEQFRVELLRLFAAHLPRVKA